MKLWTTICGISTVLAASVNVVGCSSPQPTPQSPTSAVTTPAHTPSTAATTQPIPWGAPQVFDAEQWEAHKQFFACSDPWFLGILRRGDEAPRIVAVGKTVWTDGVAAEDYIGFSAQTWGPVRPPAVAHKLWSGVCGALTATNPIKFIRCEIVEGDPSRAVLSFAEGPSEYVGQVLIELKDDNTVAWTVLRGHMVDRSNSQTALLRRVNGVAP